MLLRPDSSLIDNAQLRVIAEWLDCASRWLEDEVQDNRERDSAEGVSNPQQISEILTFLRLELDRDGDRIATNVQHAVGYDNPSESFEDGSGADERCSTLTCSPFAS
jgi:hypothetical protein